jgi:elongation factor 1 alpha-like protein
MLDKFAPAKPTPPAESKKVKPVSRFDQAAKSVQTDAKSTPGRQAAFHSLSRNVQDWACTAPGLEEVERSQVAFTDRIAAKAEVLQNYTAAAPAFLPPMMSLARPPSPSPTEFFWDTPWNNVAPERQGCITVIPALPRGRLLGGSKLAALAAARKKKQQEEADRAHGALQTTDSKAETDKAVALLDKLTVKGKEYPQSPTPQGNERKGSKNRLQYRKRQPSPEPAPAEPEEETPVEQQEPSIQLPPLRIGPSSFASALCGNGISPSIWAPSKAEAPERLTEVLPKVVDGNPFAGPSPDDIVLRAQAKGKRAVHG